jgi:hypothetical protein
MLYDCPVHTDEYSRTIIREMFGNKYDLTEMKLIGSGTIAQVYKTGDKCIKVRHPNVVSEVMDAVATYDSIKNSYFMPVALKMACDAFFEGLVIQLDFHQEFANGKLFKELAHGETDGINNLFIIPRMLDTSDECLVMEYEPSQSIALCERDKIDKHTLLRACYCMSVFANVMYYFGLYHMDIHFGNFGFRDDKIVIYDFGFITDVRGTNHNQILKSKYLYDFDIIIKYLHLKPQDEIGLRLVLGDIQKGNANEYYKINKTALKYAALNNILLDKNIVSGSIVMKNCEANADIVTELEKDEKYRYYTDHIENHGWISFYDTYFKYDDIRKMRDLSVELLKEGTYGSLPNPPLRERVVAEGGATT